MTTEATTFRVHITGASGSGTTTLGAAIADRLGIPHHDTDDFYWRPTDPPYTTKRPVEERLALLEPLLRGSPAWVLSGSVSEWADPLLPLVDLVVFLLVPTEVRIDRLRARERAELGEAAIAAGGPLHENHAEFLRWAAGYDGGPLTMRSRARHEEWLSRLRCPVLRLEGVRPVEEHLDAVLAKHPGR